MSMSFGPFAEAEIAYRRERLIADYRPRRRPRRRVQLQRDRRLPAPRRVVRHQPVAS